MKRLLLLPFVLCACSHITPKLNNNTIPDRLKYCNLSTHKPSSLPSIITADLLKEYYNNLELSRETVILELRECDLKRKALLELFIKEPKI